MKKDLNVRIPSGEKLRILQLTDMQIIDATQRRSPNRLSPETIISWDNSRIEQNCYSHIRDLITQTQPHLIIITGDIIYGEFDDSGKILNDFAKFMGSFGIPWAPVFGNHDAESAYGIEAICKVYENADNCLFCTQTDNVADGYGNYAVKIYRDDKLIEMVYMLDSKGCSVAYDDCARLPKAITENQCRLIEAKAREAELECGYTVPSIAAWHIPTQEVFDVFEEKGYPVKEGFVLGATIEAQRGDFGAFYEKRWSNAASPNNFVERLKACGVNGVFVGHDHLVNTSVLWKDIRWTFGLKTGVYDYRPNGALGGTLIEIDNGEPAVRHIPSLVGY